MQIVREIITCNTIVVIMTCVFSPLIYNWDSPFLLLRPLQGLVTRFRNFRHVLGLKTWMLPFFTDSSLQRRRRARDFSLSTSWPNTSSNTATIVLIISLQALVIPIHLVLPCKNLQIYSVLMDRPRLSVLGITEFEMDADRAIFKLKSAVVFSKFMYFIRIL